jgi:hypothetical protein
MRLQSLNHAAIERAAIERSGCPSLQLFNDTAVERCSGRALQSMKLGGHSNATSCEALECCRALVVETC